MTTATTTGVGLEELGGCETVGLHFLEEGRAVLNIRHWEYERSCMHVQAPLSFRTENEIFC